MKHLWSLICEKSSIDFETNTVSIFNCIEELGIVTDKLVDQIPLSFQILGLWELEGEKNLALKIEVIDPNKNIINTLNANFPINGVYKRFRSRLNIQGMPVNKSGRYVIKISRKLEDVDKYKNESEIPLDLNIQVSKNNLTPKL